MRVELTTFALQVRRSNQLSYSGKNSHTGTRTRVGWVKTSYPNHLDYMGMEARKGIEPLKKPSDLIDQVLSHQARIFKANSHSQPSSYELIENICSLSETLEMTGIEPARFGDQGT